MTERVPCKSEDCSATILPATALKTGGYCMPCQQAAERSARQAYIEMNRKDIDLYEGVRERVEVLKIMHAPVKHDPLIRYIPYPESKEQIYCALSGEEEAEMLAYGFDLLKAGDEDRGQDILLSLVCYRNVVLGDQILEYMVEQPSWEGVFFKGASPYIRDLLLERVESDSENRNHLLLALAWIGDDQVEELFAKWREEAPAWAKELHVHPADYAAEAGWELDENGQRRDLFLPISFAIEETGGTPSHPPSRVGMLEPSKQSCLWCGGPLTRLLNIRKDHPALGHLPLASETIRFETCILCSCYGAVYMEADEHGNPQWSPRNERPAYLPEREEGDGLLPEGAARFAPAAEPRSSYHAASWILEASDSQIGGHPTWIQDADYPVCPCCGKRMINVAQLDWGVIEEYGEGHYYLFLCPEDNLTATSYQSS